MINAKSFLILIKEEDRTHEIDSFQKQDDTILITFNKSQKTYSYSLDNCKIFDNPKLLSTCYINNTIICNAELIVQFEKYVKVFFNDKNTELFLIDKDEDILPKTNMFNYCQCIAQKIKMPENDTSLLGSSYEKIKNIKEDSALYAYLTKTNQCYIQKR